jgi:cytochrome b subunit of formate dehydrogenase
VSFSAARINTNRLKLAVLALFTLMIPVWLAAQHGGRMGGEGEGMMNSSESPLIEEKRRELAAGVHKKLGCSECHGETEHGFEKLDPVTTCADCHKPQMAVFAESIHAVSVDEAKPNAASCVACHGSHDVLAVANPQSPVSRWRVTEATCARCHDREVLSPDRGAPRNFVADYRQSFHGLSAALGDRRVANCASCHSYHAILPSDNPLSTVNRKNLVQTCGACHAGATGATFATGGVHYNPDVTGFRIVDFVRAMYLMMITLAIGFMLTHNAIDLYGRLRDRFRRKKREMAKKTESGESNSGQPRPSEGEQIGGNKSESSLKFEPKAETKYPRFTLNERIQHWTLAASFFLLVVTGFALKYTWQAPFLEAQEWALWRGFLHRAAATVFIALSVYHVAFMLLTRRGRDNLRAFLPKFRTVRDILCGCAACFRLGPPSVADWKNLIQIVKYNLGFAPAPPAMGRFNYAEKLEYFGLVWGSTVMIITGLVLWFETPFLNRFPYWGIELATAVHYYEAILATLSILVWHFYFTIFNPDVFPLSRAMITGEIDREEMERNHRLELEKIEKVEAVEKE